MRFRISHTTHYTYSQAVILEPHVLRLRPRCDGTQRLSEFSISVQPIPQRWAEWVDSDGNAAASAWFDGMSDSLHIASSLTVETHRSNPFDFLLEPRATVLPIAWYDREAVALAGYRQRRFGDSEIDAFAADIKYNSGELTTFFLSGLAREIHANFAPIHRTYGLPTAPIETLRRREGSCRDLALLYVETCRAVGLPARFVSGYHLPFQDTGQRSLHAWAEVYLPTAGWRGFDPSVGLAASDRHVAVAAGADPSDATPILGCFRSYGVQASLDVTVVVEGL